jgi:predicted ATP-grasp superfamily ATP-dependent carboligase/protein-tyrosine-phosphatase
VARPVLIFNAVPHVVVAVSRSLRRRGIPVTFASVQGYSQAPRSRALYDCVQLPSHHDAPQEFAAALMQLIESRGYDMLIPCSDPGLAAAIDSYDRLSSLLHVGCPPPAIVRSVLDKSQTLKRGASCGIAVPQAYDAPDLEALELLRTDLCFPMIAKPLSKEDETRHTFKMRYFASFDDLRDAFILDPKFGRHNLLQEYCAGEGVGVEILLHQNQPVALFQHRRIKEFPASGGGSVTSVSEPVDPFLADQAIALLRRLGWQGVAMVEFKFDRRKQRAVLMEVNGRYWGSLPLAIGAGIDFPFYEWQLAHGEEPSPPASYRAGLRFRWLGGDIRRLGSLLAETPQDGFPRPAKGEEMVHFLKDFRPSTCPAIWSWSDPLPAIDDTSAAIRRVAGILARQVARKGRRAMANYRYHGRAVSLAFLRLRALSRMGLKRERLPRDLNGVESIVFVCHGNIIRSAMAEGLLRKHLAGSRRAATLSIASAGLTEKLQERADPRARFVAWEFGISLEEHRPQRLTSRMIEQARMIFIMDALNEASIRLSYPEANGKVFYLGMLSAAECGRASFEIADPNLGTMADIRRCYRVLDPCVRQLASLLGAGRADVSPPKSAA